MAARKPPQGIKTTPAHAKRMFGHVLIAVDKHHLRVAPGHRAIVEFDGKSYDAHVTKSTGDGRVQLTVKTPISKGAKSLEAITGESRATRLEFQMLHDRLRTGNASIHLLPELHPSLMPGRTKAKGKRK